MLHEQLTVIQNFILTDKKFAHIQSNLGLSSTVKVLDKCKFIVNYKLHKYHNEVYDLYQNHITDLTFYNWIEDEQFTWAKTTMALLKQVKTPYVFYLTEDRMFHNTTINEFSQIMDEVVNNDIGYMCIGKLHKYSNSQWPAYVRECANKPAYLDNNDHIYTFLSKNDPHGCLSIDSIFRRDIFEASLQRIINRPEKFPHVLEFGDNWLQESMPDLLCAVPKNIVIVSDDDPNIDKI
jgi:hypothetical protein